MPSQLEYLRESLAKLKAAGAQADNPGILGLKAQIARFEREAQRRPDGGFWDEDGKLKPQFENPF